MAIQLISLEKNIGMVAETPFKTRSKWPQADTAILKSVENYFSIRSKVLFSEWSSIMMHDTLITTLVTLCSS